MNLQQYRVWTPEALGGVNRSCLALYALIFLLLLSGCTVGPNFSPPQPEVPDSWSGDGQQALAADTDEADTQSVPLAQWWLIFGDTTLNSLEQRAISANLDLQMAEARIRQSRATAKVALGNLGPTVTGTGAFQHNRSSELTSDRVYQLGFDALWERDFFGGQKRNVEAAQADVLTTVESRNDVLVSLTAEVARDYIQLRTYQRQLELSSQNSVAQQHTLDLIRKRFASGFASALEVALAEAEAAAVESQIPLLAASVRQSIHSLSIILGEEPAALASELSVVATIPSVDSASPIGVPSDLLRRRPDIRAAEARIHGATARIGVATSDLFPKFTLTGSLGYRATNAGSLLDWSNRYWSWGPSVSWNIFNMGRLQANVEVQKILQEQEIISYYQTVQKGLQEVEDALVSLNKGRERSKSLMSAATANRRSVVLATRLYAEGLSDFTSVLEAQQALYTTEDSLVQTTGALSTSLVALYKALGGGWES